MVGLILMGVAVVVVGIVMLFAYVRPGRGQNELGPGDVTHP